MTFGSLALLWLLADPQPTPQTMPKSMAMTDLVRYAPRPTPFASTTLFVYGPSNAVTVLARTNADVKILPAQYQDLRISRAFYVECFLPRNDGLRRIRVWADTPSHLLPVDVVDYHPFDSSYVKLDIDTGYLENRSDDLTLANHEIHIEFYTDH